jgi:hypothetical protein
LLNLSSPCIILNVFFFFKCAGTSWQNLHYGEARWRATWSCKNPNLCSFQFHMFWF